MASLKVKLIAGLVVIGIIGAIALYGYLAIVPHSTTVTVSYGQSAQSTGLMQQGTGKPIP